MTETSMAVGPEEIERVAERLADAIGLDRTYVHEQLSAAVTLGRVMLADNVCVRVDAGAALQAWLEACAAANTKLTEESRRQVVGRAILMEADRVAARLEAKRPMERMEKLLRVVVRETVTRVEICEGRGTVTEPYRQVQYWVRDDGVVVGRYDPSVDTREILQAE